MCILQDLSLLTATNRTMDHSLRYSQPQNALRAINQPCLLGHAAALEAAMQISFYENDNSHAQSTQHYPLCSYKLTICLCGQLFTEYISINISLTPV